MYSICIDPIGLYADENSNAKIVKSQIITKNKTLNTMRLMQSLSKLDGKRSVDICFGKWITKAVTLRVILSFWCTL
jgi:hypothetical protein